MEILKSISLAEYTTLQIGGTAEYFCVVKNESELEEAVAYANEHNLKIHVLGGGSNLLVNDDGVSGLVIKNEIIGFESVEKGDLISLTVGAGCLLDETVSKTVTHGWWGMENLSHIPGTVGATPVQNVGAYGVEVRDIIESVRVYSTADNSFKELSAEECQFGYRDSVFKKEEGKNYIVTAVTYKLSLVPKPVVSYKDLKERFTTDSHDQNAIREAVIEIRSHKFPNWHEVGTAGSFFKNPVIDKEHYKELLTRYPDLPSYPVSEDKVKLPLAYVLDKICNLKGIAKGNVGSYEGQALVLVNHGGATAIEVKEFVSMVVGEVKEKIGVDIEWEVTRW